MKTKSSIPGPVRSTRMARHLRITSAFTLLSVLSLPPSAKAQFIYTTTSGAITITGYTGAGGFVNIPGTINGRPVVSIGDGAFSGNGSLTVVVIPDSVNSIGGAAFESCSGLTNVAILGIVTNIGASAFSLCTSLTAILVVPQTALYSSVNGVLFNRGQTTLVQYPGGLAGSYTVPGSVTSIAADAFENCYSLTSVTIPNSVADIGSYAFANCTGLTNITIGNQITSIGFSAFSDCTSLTGVYFQGNPPSVGLGVFDAVNNVVVYYLPGTTGWGLTFGGRATALWNPQVQSSGAGFGLRSNQFGFNITWGAARIIVVEASTNLGNPIWSLLTTNTLIGGTFYFRDPKWTNYPDRFYRLRSP